MVEDVFAVGMAFEIERRAGDDPAGRFGQRKVLRLPAGARIGRAAILERRQEGVGDEWIVGAGTGVPGRRVDRRQLGRYAQAVARAVTVHDSPGAPQLRISKIASTSTA